MLIAQITFYPFESGGRMAPPLSGFHPQVAIGEYQTSCRVESLSGEESFNFSTEHKVKITPFFPEIVEGKFEVGVPINIYEGNKRIGSGIIVEV